MTVLNESTAVKVTRPIYRLEQINQNFQYENPKENSELKKINSERILVNC